MLLPYYGVTHTTRIENHIIVKTTFRSNGIPSFQNIKKLEYAPHLRREANDGFSLIDRDLNE